MEYNDYREELDRNLRNIQDVDCINCRNVMCNEHCADINQLCVDITEACIKVAELTIPCRYSDAGGYKIVLGWNEYVEPYRKKSVLWHKFWIENEKPKHGFVADIMRKTMSDYHHHHVRWAKRNSRSIVSQKMADSVKTGHMNKIWSDVKRIRGSKTTVTASLDGETGDVRIANVFACKYNALYNCVSYDSNDLNGIKREIDTPALESTDITCVTTD